MARYIDADKFEKDIASLPYGYRGMVQSILFDQPTADVVEVKYGKWLVIENDEDELWAGGGRYECSACGYGFSFAGFFEMNEQHYCPHCGARMEAWDGEIH